LILVLGGLFILLSQFNYTFILDVIKDVLHYCIDINFKVSYWISNLPNSTIEDIYINPLQMLILFVIISLFIALFLQPKKLTIIYILILFISLEVINISHNSINYNKKEVVSILYKKQPLITVLSQKRLYGITVLDSVDFITLPFIKNYMIMNGVSKEDVSILSPSDSLKTADNELFISKANIVLNEKNIKLDD
jgi:hypothetical protein